MAFVSTSFSSFKPYERKYYLYDRSPFASVSMIALEYQPTDRIKSLSKPKIRKETTIRDGKKECRLIIKFLLNKKRISLVVLIYI